MGRVVNMSSSSSPSRSRLWKDFTTPLCQGIPGGMNASTVSCLAAQLSQLIANAPGPLSIRNIRDPPPRTTAKFSSRSITAVAVIDRASLKPPYSPVNSSIAFADLEGFALVVAINREVLCPHLPRTRRWLRTECGRGQAPWLTSFTKKTRTHYVVSSSASRSPAFVFLAPYRGKLCLSAFLLPCGNGTSRWLRYGLFSSLSNNDPGGDAAEGSDILQTANRNLTPPSATGGTPHHGYS